MTGMLALHFAGWLGVALVFETVCFLLGGCEDTKYTLFLFYWAAIITIYILCYSGGQVVSMQKLVPLSLVWMGHGLFIGAYSLD
ncbi:hypothetical protein BVX94_02040 [bacterium B17]|nr:hypothetical protein BVX94_02040 [bacterium B17]